MDDAFFVFEYTGTAVIGFLQLVPADGANGGNVLAYGQLSPAAPDDLILVYYEEDEVALPSSDDFGTNADLVLADMTDAVEADGGAVLTAFSEAAIGTDGGDLLMGDGGIEASVMAELLAGVADLAA